MRFLLLSFSCAFLGGFWIGKVGASCYYPDGSFPSDYVYTACSGSEFTSCCIASEGDQCLSNGLCYYPKSSSKYLFRGACTDKTWKSENCFQHCLSGSSNSRYDRLVSCGDNRYCCYSDGSTCCNDDSKVFNIGNTTVIKDFATSTASYTFPIQTPTNLPKTSAKTSTTNTQQPLTDQNTAAAATATSTTTSTSIPPPTQPHGISKTIVIAGAIGGLILLIAAISLVWFCLRRRYRNKLATGTNNQTPQSFPMSSDGFQKLPDKTPRPVENVTPLHSPAPPYQPYQPYQPPAYQGAVQQNGYGHGHGNGNGNGNGTAVEIDDSYLAPSKNQWGQPVYEAPDQMYRRI